MLLFLLSLCLYSAEASNKYKPAIKTATEAAYIQSGLEADFINARNNTNKKVTLWLKRNDLEEVGAVVGFVTPIVHKKRVRFKLYDIVIKADKSKISADWNFQF